MIDQITLPAVERMLSLFSSIRFRMAVGELQVPKIRLQLSAKQLTTDSAQQCVQRPTHLVKHSSIAIATCHGINFTVRKPHCL